jgi:hypothetical protein
MGNALSPGSVSMTLVLSAESEFISDELAGTWPRIRLLHHLKLPDVEVQVGVGRSLIGEVQVEMDLVDRDLWHIPAPGLVAMAAVVIGMEVETVAETPKIEMV